MITGREERKQCAKNTACIFSKKHAILPLQIFFSTHGGYSSMVEHWVVVPATRVRFPLVAPQKILRSPKARRIFL